MEVKNVDKKSKMLAEIGQVSFSINDLVLYLDTHPEDQDALAYMQQLQARRREALTTFEAEHYPLVLDCMGDDVKETWTWGSAPAPWEVEANVEL